MRGINMKLLLEQKEYLEKKILSLQEKKARLQEQKKQTKVNNNFSYNTVFEDSQLLTEELGKSEREINEYQSLLSTAEIITTFNNEQIDFGTSFKVKFQDVDEIYEYTLIEVNLGSEFNSQHGYITKESKLGSAIYMKSVSSKFYYDIDGEEIAGEVLEIIPKNFLTIKQKEVPEKSEIQKVNMVNKEKPRRNRTLNEEKCTAFVEYHQKLKKYANSSANIKKELARLQMITSSQEVCLKKLLVAENRKNYKYVSSKASLLQRLARKIIRPEDLTTIDFGTEMLLEIESNGKKKIKSLELVPLFCGLQAEDRFISVRNRIGFALYKGQVGDVFDFIKTVYEPHQKIKVLQFGIHKDHLLIPDNSNLPSLSQKEREESLIHFRYQKKNCPDMTISQWKLFDIELSKVSDDAERTPYISRLYALKDLVSEDNIRILTEKRVKENNDKVGIGSVVHYALTTDDKKEEYTTEMIACAYTVEEDLKYTEAFSTLGKSMMGKKKGESFEWEIDGSVQKGVILSVYNETLEQYRDCNQEWETYYESNRPKLVSEQAILLKEEKDRENEAIELLRSKLISIDDVTVHGNYDTQKSAVQKEIITKYTRIKQIESALNTSVIVENHVSDIIEIGSEFSIILDNEEPLDFVLIEKMIAGESSERFLSIESNLGKAVLHKKVGDSFSLVTESGDTINGFTAHCEQKDKTTSFTKVKK